MSRWSFLSGWKRTAKLYVKSKIGMIGLIVIVFFLILAVFAPQIDSNNPVTCSNVATPLSPPDWATIFPQYHNLVPTSSPIPATGLNTKAAISAWKMSGQNYNTTTYYPLSNVSTTSGSTVITVPAGGFLGVTNGTEVSGPGIPASDTVTTVKGKPNSLTLSKPATATGTVTLDFYLSPGPQTNVCGVANIVYPGSMLVKASIVPNQTIADAPLAAANAQLPYGQVFYSMSRPFTFNSAANQSFTFQAQVLLRPLTMVNVSDIYIDFIISGPTGNWSLATVTDPVLGPLIDISNTPINLVSTTAGSTNITSIVGFTGVSNGTEVSGPGIPASDTVALTKPNRNWLLLSEPATATGSVNLDFLQSSWQTVNVLSTLVSSTNIPVLGNTTNPSSVVFAKKGTYDLTMELQGVPCQPGGVAQMGTCVPGNNTSISVLIATANFHISGDAYGLLGTDNLGRDIWSEFVWGSQISLLIGVLSGVGAVALGTIAGLAAGYLGGGWDEIISRVTDFVLVLPFLPFLIICVFIIQQNPAALANVYWWIIIIFVVISWPSIAKIIRSQVLTVKEREYVEASRALGGGTGHIIRKHILPNVMGLVYSQVALNVSGFILLEAALDYLSISIHSITTITWGIMLTQSLPFAVGDSLNSYVWWWFLPPGIAIAALSLAFVLVGFALDSVFNPRLRAR